MVPDRRGPDRGRAACGRELDALGARPIVADVHDRFRPHNRRFGAACSDWQVRPSADDPMAVNDHSDPGWDDRVLRTLRAVESSFAELWAELSTVLTRFAPYPPLYSAALRRADAGETGWVDAPDRDSLHLLWIQFHEDLLTTLGIERGTDA